MKQSFFTPDDTLYSITCSFPETIAVFESNGFPQMGDPVKREQFGKSITLRQALHLKNKDVAMFSSLLDDVIAQHEYSADATLTSTDKHISSDAVRITGLLPCPVRIPLLEAFSVFAAGYEKKHHIALSYDLQAASMGVQWIEENLVHVKDEDSLPDLFISAGFDMFFDESLIGTFKKNGVFADSSPLDHYNALFSGIDLKDPKGHYAMLGVVPAVFLVNTEELGDRNIPASWSDILKPEFKASVSLPVGDFDLFNSILIHIHKQYGDKGVSQLGRNLLESLHPSQMIKSEHKRNNRPAVTIMPYFFTRMIKEGSAMRAVWPEDGAIISPIFMLAKKARLEKLQPVIDFLSSKEIGSILSHQGLFPSVHPEVDNRIPRQHSFMWIGWDYIYNHDITQLIRHCTLVFQKAC